MLEDMSDFAFGELIVSRIRYVVVGMSRECIAEWVL